MTAAVPVVACLPWAGTLEVDAELAIVTVSPGLCTRLGCPEGSLDGRRLDTLFSPRDRKGQRHFDEAHAGGSADGIDLMITLSIAGNDVLVRLQMVPDGDRWQAHIEPLGQPSNLIAALFSTQERWASIVKRSSEGVVILDAHGKIVEVNASFLELMPFRSPRGVILSEEALRGRPLVPLLQAHGSGLAPLGQHLALLQAGDREAHGDAVIEMGGAGPAPRRVASRPRALPCDVDLGRPLA